MPAVLFFSRCKPHQVDVQRVALEHRCVFFGYPLGRLGAAYKPDDPNSFLVSPAANESEWLLHFRKGLRKSAQHSMNRNLVQKVGQGSIALLPRPQDGLIYAGRVKGTFRISHDEDRYQAALKVFLAEGKSDGEEVRLSGELAQGWDVEEWVPLPIPVVPGWIRGSLFGRSTYCIVGDKGHPEQPRDVIARLMDLQREGRSFNPRCWTLDRSEIRHRLFETLTPSLFEGLIVALLQLEQPDLCWIGVGGSGDGGVDGLASDDDGDVVALLQCKWVHNDQPAFGEPSVWPQQRKPVHRYLAFMAGGARPVVGADEVIGPEQVIDLVAKHFDRLPLAMSLRIGRAPQ
jgi:hypothetical protein